MNWNDYEIKAMRTQADQQVILDRLHSEKGPKIMQLIIGVMGLSDEVGELNNAVKKCVEYNRTLDVTNVKEEVGDCLWRLAQICAAVDISLEECAEANIKKLSLRYPEKFTDHLAAEENRDREAERKTLEGSPSVTLEIINELPPLDLTQPRITEPANYQPHGYDGICVVCKREIHHTNKTGLCASCFSQNASVE